MTGNGPNVGRTCPLCADEILPGAIKCRYCTKWISEPIQDPNKPGPWGWCLRCFTPYDDKADFAFCARCGKYGTVFVPTGATGKCKYDGNAAVGECCLCSKPVCESCKGKSHLSLASGIPLLYCQHCLKKSAEIETGFLNEISAKGLCLKHPQMPSRFRCIECSDPLCPYCSYFRRKGLFKNRLNGGPYCLVCFRLKRFPPSERKWLSGFDAIKLSLL